MKRAFYLMGLLFIFIVTFVLWNSAISFAADPPAGSYKNTCKDKDIEYDGTNITYASCKKLNGLDNDTSLYNAKSCAGIENCDGNLRCTGGITLPDGSYRKSCTCCSIQKKLVNEVEKDHVCCLCKNKSGKYQPETCTQKTCSKTIQNSDGTLACQ